MSETDIYLLQITCRPSETQFFLIAVHLGSIKTIRFIFKKIWNCQDPENKQKKAPLLSQKLQQNFEKFMTVSLKAISKSVEFVERTSNPSLGLLKQNLRSKTYSCMILCTFSCSLSGQVN